MWATALLNNAVGIISKVLVNKVSNTLLIFEESLCGYQVKCIISVQNLIKQLSYYTCSHWSIGVFRKYGYLNAGVMFKIRVYF